MKRIFSGNKSPVKNITDKYNNDSTSQTIERLDRSLNPTEQDQVSPELVPILTLLSAHLHRRYHEGVLLMLEDLKNDGTPGARKWQEMYAVLIGTQLALWNANDLNGTDETALKNSATKPTYINFTDANIQCIETVKSVSAQDNKKLENILVVSTTLKNRYFLQFSNRESFNQWNAAIRLSLYESTSLQEAYTGAFISSRGSRLSDIGVLLASTRFDYEEWVSVRFGVGMPWKRCYAVITQNVNKKKDTLGEINFYENDKKIKKQNSMTTVTHATAIYAVYPSSPKLIDNSTMIKLEGKAKFKGNDATQETNLFIMPEKHEAVPCYDTIIRFLLPAMNAFRLYGRPKKLIANKDDPISLLYALPSLPHIYYLQVEDLIPLAKSSNCLYWSSSEWKDKIRDILQTKLTKGYSGCGSSTSLKNILGAPFLESGELFQKSGNILSPLLGSVNSKRDISPSRLNVNKVYQKGNSNNNNSFKSLTSLVSSSSKSVESPLNLNESSSLTKIPVNLNDSKKIVSTEKLSNPSQNHPMIQKDLTPSSSSYIKEKENRTFTNNVPMNQGTGPEMIKNPQISQNNYVKNLKEPQHTGTQIMNQLEKKNQPSQYNERYDNFILTTMNTRETNRPSFQKSKPQPLKLQHSNFDSFNNQLNEGNHDNAHSRIESSYSFLIDAYREIEDNNDYDHPEFSIKMKQLSLSKENTISSHEHDVFDPEFVEQNQMLEMENIYGSMTSTTQRYPDNQNGNSGYKEQPYMKQESAIKNVYTNINNKRDEDITPEINITNKNNNLNTPIQKMIHKKPPPPPGFQQQQIMGENTQRMNQPLQEQTGYSPSMPISKNMNSQIMSNPYSKGEDTLVNTRLQPVAVRAQVPNGNPNIQPQSIGYHQSPHNTTASTNRSPVFNTYPLQNQHHSRPPPQYTQPYINSPTNLTANKNINGMVASQKQQQQRDRYTQNVPYNNTGNHNYMLQNQYSPMNQRFQGPKSPQNYISNRPYPSNRQFNGYNNQPQYLNSRPMYNNNPNNNATDRYTTAPFCPQPPPGTTGPLSPSSSSSPHQRQFIRPKPTGFSQYMPSSNRNNGVNPYGGL